MQKHEKDAVAGIIEVAIQFGITAQVGKPRNNRHPTVVILQTGDNRVTLSLPSSPRDRTWTVMVAQKKAKSLCEAMSQGIRPPPHQHI